ncbi:NAD(P)-dependent alcohol dehydrogenase [Trujillonella endophytica]|uniref:NAD(P)-dependent alcohol dehydrogenase n=1 Tax=Trujillonella endophytica TaxID=673521 RepID=UPI000B83C55D|nr:NAD(P)-dependent alcohol dehydrogenase [Trujillella endophytica]
MTGRPTAVTAAVLRDPAGPLELVQLELAPPRAGEVVVRLVSTGICGTDLEFRSMMTPPVVLGHEGAGIVEQVGEGVTDLAVGDPVALTFAFCGECGPCSQQAMAYCENFWQYNFIGTRPDGSTALSQDGQPVHGHFLGQSSFATHVLARRGSVVKVPEGTDLRVVGPFGCGFQTGAGGVLNVLRPAPGSSIAVFGAGAVGAAAILGAVEAGCTTIVAVDVNPAKLEQARALGATHAVSAAEPDLAERVRAEVPGGLQYSLDTTGRADVLRAAVESLAPLGVCGVIGVGASAEMSFEWRSILSTGRSVVGITAGASVPEEFLPRLVELHRAGRFPVDGLLTHYPFAEVNRALDDVRAGRVGKAVLTFDA